MSKHLLIFDLDGTLIDSEMLCNRAFVDLLPNLEESVESLVLRYRGMKLSVILSDLGSRLGKSLPADFETTYRERVAHLFSHHLEPTPGANEMLSSIAYPYCLASSGPRNKIQHALRVSGLMPYFGENIFSAYEVGSWKPDPELFLHASTAMGFPVNKCVVVDDSNLGIEAARRAGMKAIQYIPDTSGSTKKSGDTIGHMSELSSHLGILVGGAK